MNHELDWFYKSGRWKDCRRAYMKQVGGLCEVCLSQGLVEPAVIVHHKIHLSPVNVNDTRLSLSPDNLIALCKKHHAAEHPELYKGRDKRWTVSPEGKVLAKDSPPVTN